MGLLATIADRLKWAETLLTRRERQRKLGGVFRQFAAPYMLNVGCGPVPFPGWVNIDLSTERHVDLTWDINDGLPFPDGSCRFIYNEHFIEHISVPQATAFMKESWRVLQPGGVLRIGTPSVAESVRRYHEDDWRDQPWMVKHGYTWIQTRAEMINICFREWGHQWLYDEEELTRRLRESGFEKIAVAPWGRSEHPDLCDRETRPETRVIIEATR